MSATVELTCMILFHAGCDRSPYPEKWAILSLHGVYATFVIMISQTIQ